MTRIFGFANSVDKWKVSIIDAENRSISDGVYSKGRDVWTAKRFFGSRG